MHDVRAGFERNARKVQTKLLAHAQVHLVVHQPQRHLRNLRRKLLNLYPVKLIHIHANQTVDIHALLARIATQLMAGAQHLQLQQAQLAVTDHQKIATATGRIKKRQAPQLLVELLQALALVFDPRKLRVQIVQKQRAN